MEIVLMESLEVRANKFAALSEPARLRIVDLLALGDLSPTEVQFTLGMPSNLVAHHLGVLEKAGLLSRRRSESDGRRSYLRLVPGAFDRLAHDPKRISGRVVFICTANSARSQMAEAIWRQVSSIPTASAGTDPAEHVNETASHVAAQRGLTLAASIPQSVSEVLQEDDFVVTVCDRAHEELGGIDDLHWSISDPARHGTETAFNDALDELSLRITAFAQQIVV